MRYRKRVDGNHAQIRDAWRQKGWKVTDTSHVGHGFPDLVGWQAGKWVFVEVKDGRNMPSRRRLTAPEQDMHVMLIQAGCDVRIVERIEDLP